MKSMAKPIFWEKKEINMSSAKIITQHAKCLTLDNVFNTIGFVSINLLETDFNVFLY